MYEEKWLQLEATLQQTADALKQYEAQTCTLHSKAHALEAESTKLRRKLERGSREVIGSRLLALDRSITAAADERERALAECRRLQQLLGPARAAYRAAHPIDIALRPTARDALEICISIAC